MALEAFLWNVHHPRGWQAPPPVYGGDWRPSFSSVFSTTRSRTVPWEAPGLYSFIPAFPPLFFTHTPSPKEKKEGRLKKNRYVLLGLFLVVLGGVLSRELFPRGPNSWADVTSCLVPSRRPWMSGALEGFSHPSTADVTNVCSHVVSPWCPPGIICRVACTG